MGQRRPSHPAPRQMRPPREASSGPQIQTDEVSQGDLQGDSDNVSSCPGEGVSDCVQSDLFPQRRVDSPELTAGRSFSERPRMDWSHPRSEAEECLSGAPLYSGPKPRFWRQIWREGREEMDPGRAPKCYS
ncbi:Hypothetical predicted protein [Marmota monax]|uniref:Uncharacterized protein n=1 Tax=Marmota monax TaxID=9995 RepID=A0A5E4CE72_MARMO|nr:Hypothetical predicted protein [Marmota monax]